MTIVKTLAAALAIAALPGLAAAARPALRDVPEIENGLFAVAIADAVRDHCGSIDARVIKALGFLRQIKAKANALGYSDAEIRAYVESRTEKARMREKGWAYLNANGVTRDDPETFCTFGRAEIAKNSAIGALLRAK
ncbi:MAG: DUF5333 domain-containing protein [Pseudooceanicola sp.]|nr:DUF5333 domain-containing protein [Pseudooceanicola sp.]